MALIKTSWWNLFTILFVIISARFFCNSVQAEALADTSQDVIARDFVESGRGNTMDTNPTPTKGTHLMPSAVVRIAGTEGDSLSSAVVNQLSETNASLLYSFSDSKTGLIDQFHKVIDLPPSVDATTSVALIPRALGDPNIVWVACADGHALRGALLNHFKIVRLFGPTSLGTLGGKLLKRGVSLTDGGGVLVAIGDDMRSLSVIHITPAGGQKIYEIKLTHPIEEPEKIVLVAAVEESVHVYLFWVEDQKEVRELSFDAINPESRINSNVVYVSKGRIVEIQSEPPDPTSPSWVHVLEVPDNKGDSLILTRLQPITGRVVDTAELPSPSSSVARVKRWLLPLSGVSASGPLLFVADEFTWLFNKNQWRQIRLPISNTMSTELIQFSGEPWLSTWSAEGGVQLLHLSTGAE